MTLYLSSKNTNVKVCGGGGGEGGGEDRGKVNVLKKSSLKFFLLCIN